MHIHDDDDDDDDTRIRVDATRNETILRSSAARGAFGILGVEMLRLRMMMLLVLPLLLLFSVPAGRMKRYSCSCVLC